VGSKILVPSFREAVLGRVLVYLFAILSPFITDFVSLRLTKEFSSLRAPSDMLNPILVDIAGYVTHKSRKIATKIPSFSPKIRRNLDLRSNLSFVGPRMMLGWAIQYGNSEVLTPCLQYKLPIHTLTNVLSYSVLADEMMIIMLIRNGILKSLP
jgi:hypothetical protein